MHHELKTWQEISKEDLEQYYPPQENPFNFKRKSITKFYRKLDYPIRSITLKGTTSVDGLTHDEAFFFSFGYKISKNAHWEIGTHCPIELLTEIPKLVDEFISLL
jgi:hypothetical protein